MVYSTVQCDKRMASTCANEDERYDAIGEEVMKIMHTTRDFGDSVVKALEKAIVFLQEEKKAEKEKEVLKKREAFINDANSVATEIMTKVSAKELYADFCGMNQDGTASKMFYLDNYSMVRSRVMIDEYFKKKDQTYCGPEGFLYAAMYDAVLKAMCAEERKNHQT